MKTYSSETLEKLVFYMTKDTLSLMDQGLDITFPFDLQAYCRDNDLAIREHKVKLATIRNEMLVIKSTYNLGQVTEHLDKIIDMCVN